MSFSAIACLSVCIFASNTARAQLNPDFRREDFTSGECGGSAQSPIDLSSPTQSLSASRAAKLVLPEVKQAELINKGTALQVEWDGTIGSRKNFPLVPICGDGISDCLTNPAEVIRSVRMEPLQFHFHTPSEHTIDGLYYACETHIVTIIAPGQAPKEWGCDARPVSPEAFKRCAMVFGTLYKIGSSSPAWFTSAYDNADREFESVTAWRRRFELSSLAPSSNAHYEYVGSLTTPPCTEGVRWYVAEEALEITPETMREMEQFMAFTFDGDVENIYLTNRRTLQPLNGRTVYRATDSASRA